MKDCSSAVDLPRVANNGRNIAVPLVAGPHLSENKDWRDCTIIYRRIWRGSRSGEVLGITNIAPVK